MYLVFALMLVQISGFTLVFIKFSQFSGLLYFSCFSFVLSSERLVLPSCQQAKLMEHSPVHSPFLPIHKAWRVLSSSSTCERFLEGSLGFRSFLTSLEISSGFSTASVMDSSSLYWSESLISSLFLLQEVLF